MNAEDFVKKNYVINPKPFDLTFLSAFQFSHSGNKPQ